MSNWFVRAKRALNKRTFSFAAVSAADRPNLYRRSFAFEVLEPRLTLAAAGLVTTPQTYTGALSGKVVFTSGGHGIGWNGSAFASERPDYWETSGDTSDGDLVEDLGNQDQMSLYADYLLRAGATVVPMRPVGRQINEVVLDNDSPDVTFSSGWSNSTNSRFYDEDYGATTDSISYKFASTVTGTETATATYTPNIPQAGFYPVYTWVHYGTDRTLQTYRINHTGGTTEISVDHSKVGDGWVYLGTYHFNAGKSSTGEGSVQITNKAPVTGKVVIADAIRFGNGMGDYVVSGAPGVSGAPREDEKSYEWIARSIGQGTTISGVIGSDTNVSAPSDFAQYMFHGSFGEALYVGYHSNGSTGDPNTATSRGAVGLYDNSASVRTPHQVELAMMLADQVNQDFQNLNGVFEYNWSTPATNTDSHINFGEIDLGPSAEMDATIIEVAFHDNVQDNALLRDPKVRDQIARSVYQGTVQYFSTYGSPVVTTTSLPTTPTNVRAVSDASGAVTLNWSAGPDTPTSVYGDAATGYTVYASVDGYGFDGGRTVSGGATTLTITGLATNLPYYFKVTATNSGGESEASEVVTALPTGGVKQVLIVNGFDRFDRNQDFKYPYAQSGYSTPDPDGFTNRVWPTFNNSHNYVIQVASAIQASKPGVHFASTSNEAVISGAVNLSDYNSVIWILGDESTADHTFDATEQTKVTSFINAGGNLFVSGSEIGWDLDQQNHGRTFYENTLLGNYVADDANTYTATAAAGGIFNGMSGIVFSNGTAFSQLDGQMYDVATPDVIAPQAGAVSALTYSGGTGGTAAIQVLGTGGKGNIVMFGFPFEAITSASNRQTAMGDILSFLDADIAIATRVNGQDADSAPGPSFAVGTTVTLKYVLTNPGIVPLSIVSVVDDNGTPGNAADDFNATFANGDINSNGQLDAGETWTYTATQIVAAGQTTRSGRVTATSSTTTVIKTDPANYFGIAPNADFNGDTFVDSSDYVIWRKNSGLTSGAVLAQGDANGDGAVDMADYDIWRAQYNTPISGGSGSGSAVAAALTVVAPTSTAPRVESVKDAAFGILSGSANELRGNRHGVFQWHRSAGDETHNDWASLLAALTQRKTGSPTRESSASMAENPGSEAPADCPIDSPLGLAFGQFSRRKATHTWV